MPITQWLIRFASITLNMPSPFRGMIYFMAWLWHALPWHNPLDKPSGGNCYDGRMTKAWRVSYITRENSDGLGYSQCFIDFCICFVVSWLCKGFNSLYHFRQMIHMWYYEKKQICIKRLSYYNGWQNTEITVVWLCLTKFNVTVSKIISYVKYANRNKISIINRHRCNQRYRYWLQDSDFATTKG